MDYKEAVILVLTSALVAAVVSSLFALIGQWFDRRARKRELIFSKAMDMAKLKIETVFEAAKQGYAKNIIIYDPVVLAEKYFHWLLRLHDDGRLPDDPAIERFESEAKK